MQTKLLNRATLTRLVSKIKGKIFARTWKRWEKFVANDIFFNKNQKLIILTGPNASGKSCFIRQLGLIQILAQIGSFVPANQAEIKIADRIKRACKG